jgi:hypothetical protein
MLKEMPCCFLELVSDGVEGEIGANFISIKSLDVYY